MYHLHRREDKHLLQQLFLLISLFIIFLHFKISPYLKLLNRMLQWRYGIKRQICFVDLHMIFHRQSDGYTLAELSFWGEPLL